MNNIELLQQIIAIPSLTGKEDELSDFLFDYLQKQELSPEKVGKNVLVHLPGSEGKKCIILNVHFDTVSVGDETAWKHGPFAGEIVDGKMYGLGASDNKGAVATFIKIAEWLKQNKIKNDVIVTLVVEEESTGRGSSDTVKHLVAQGIKEKYQEVVAIVAEPSRMEFAEIAHRGAAFVNASFKGKSVHSSRPHLAEDNNAVEKAAQMLLKQNELNAEFKKKYPHPVLPSPTVCFTSVSGMSGAINKLAETVTVTIDLRTTPEMHGHYMDVIREMTGPDAELSLITERAAGFTSLDSDLLTYFKQNLPQVVLQTAIGGNDMCFFSEAGIDSLVIGPGDKGVIHQANEYIDIEDLDKAQDMIVEFLKNY